MITTWTNSRLEVRGAAPASWSRAIEMGSFGWREMSWSGQQERDLASCFPWDEGAITVTWVKQPISSTVASSSPTPALPDIPDQLRKLAELRDAGILTNEEFEAKKAELLARM